MTAGMRDMFIGGGIVVVVMSIFSACTREPRAAERSIDIEAQPSVLQQLPSHVSTLHVYLLKQNFGHPCYVVEYTGGYGGVAVACQ